MDNRFEPLQTEEEIGPEASRLLNQYLQRVCAPAADVSAQEQADLREEMSDHLLAMAAAYQELGLSAEEAMQAALKQFGEAEQIGQAVAREIDKRPSLLGSPRTVSMIGGIAVAWVTMSGANLFLLESGRLDVISPEGHLLGIVLGCVTGSALWKRRRSVGQAALWNARLCAGTTLVSISALFLFLCLFSGNPGRLFTQFLNPVWLRAAVPVLLEWVTVAGIAGACSGALTSLWCRFVRRHLIDKTSPGSKNRRILS